VVRHATLPDLRPRRAATAGVTPPASRAQALHAERVAWGKKWGAVGHEYKLRRLAREA